MRVWCLAYCMHVWRLEHIRVWHLDYNICVCDVLVISGSQWFLNYYIHMYDVLISVCLSLYLYDVLITLHTCMMFWLVYIHVWCFGYSTYMYRILIIIHTCMMLWLLYIHLWCFDYYTYMYDVSITDIHVCCLDDSWGVW